MVHKDYFINTLINVMGWVTGVLIAFVVGASLILGNIRFPHINEMWEIVIGWTIIMLTILGIITKIISIINYK